MTRFTFSILVLICFLFNSKTTLSQDEVIPNDAVFHIIINQFNPIDTIKLKNEIDSVYNGDFKIWNSSDFGSRTDSAKSTNDYILTIKVHESKDDSLKTSASWAECILINTERNLTLNWEFDDLVKIHDLKTLFKWYEMIRLHKKKSFNSMFKAGNNNIQVVDKKISIDLTNNGRTVQNLNDAIEASLTINVNDGHGSGFFISDSIVVTNYHVIKGQKSITANSKNGEINLTVIVRDPELDLAILKSDQISEVYFSISKDQMEPVGVGTDILIIGSPTSKLLTNSLSSGIISGIRQIDEMNIIQTDAKINPGNSGGALLDSKGNLHGVVTAKVFGYGIEGLGFAIPTQYIIQILN